MKKIADNPRCRSIRRLETTILTNESASFLDTDRSKREARALSRDGPSASAREPRGHAIQYGFCGNFSLYVDHEQHMHLK